MLAHHRGAIAMSTDAIDRTRDPRMVMFADNVRHPQRVQAARMEEMPREMR